MPVITAKDLHKCYAGFSPVLRGANIEVERGEMVAIMGPSGCGKSTMLHILGLLHAPDSGSLSILDTDVLKLDREQTSAFRRENLGFVMQSSNMFDHSTVFENVEFPLIYDNVPPEERWERVIRALELVRLSSRVHYRSNRLSGGEQQRVAIARAMVNNPRILFADEPTGALDARTSVLIMENFRNLCHSGGVSMVMVTHDPKMAEYCDSTYTLEEGILHCQTRSVPTIRQETGNFLNSPEPVVSGALLASSFPGKSGQNILPLAELLHSQSLLAKIYALKNRLFNSHAGYALPLAVRKIGFPQLVPALLRIFRKSSPAAGESLKKYSLFRRLWLRCCLCVLTGWSEEDDIDFFLAVGAPVQAELACTLAEKQKKTWAVCVLPEDFSRLFTGFEQILDKSSFILCETAACATKICQLFGDKYQNRISIVRPPLQILPPDEDAVLPLGHPALSSAAEIKIIFLAAGSDMAWLAHLLTAIAELKAAGKKIRLIIIGKRLQNLRAKILAARIGIRKELHCTNAAALEDMARSMAESDIFIQVQAAPTLSDELALPMAIAEAMAFKMSVVATDLPGIREAIIHGQNGILIEPGNAHALGDALTFLCNSPKKRAELGAEAQKTIFNLLETDNLGQILHDDIMRAVQK